MIGYITIELAATILNDPKFNQKVTVDSMDLTKIQWGQNSFLDDTSLTFVGVPAVPSIADPTFDPTFITYPEYGYYCLV